VCVCVCAGNYEISVVRFDLHLLLVVLFFIGLINPFDFFYSRARLSLLTALSDVLFSAWSLKNTSFYHLLIADYLTSISKILAGRSAHTHVHECKYT
jgi:hypothetical protein